jgi:hypothetical protein
MWVIGFFIQFFGQFPYHGAANISQMPHWWAQNMSTKSYFIALCSSIQMFPPLGRKISVKFPMEGKQKLMPHICPTSPLP